MSEDTTSRPSRPSDRILGTVEGVVAPVARFGYGLLDLGLGLLPPQSRQHMRNAIRELSYAFASLPRDFADIAGREIEPWAVRGDVEATLIARTAAPTPKTKPAPTPGAAAPAPETKPATPAPAARPAPAPAPETKPAAPSAAAPTGAAPAPEAKPAPAAPVTRISSGSAGATATTAAITIAHIEFNPEGRDVEGEYVLIRNTSTQAADMTGWKLHDGAQRHTYIFPPFVLAPGAEVKLWTRTGANDAANLYWGQRVAVWNNEGDTGTLLDARGAVVSRYTCSGDRGKGRA